VPAARAAGAAAGFGKVFCRPCLWETSRNRCPPLAAWPRLTPRTERPERTQVLGNCGGLCGAGGDFSGIPDRVCPRVRVPTLGDAADGGPQLGGALPPYASRVAEHRVDVSPERDSAAPSSLAWCRDAQAFATYGT